MNGVGKVFQRISDIEQRFGQHSVQAEDKQSFAAVLASQSTDSKSVAPVQGYKTANPEVANLVRQSAAKYGIDSKLALAVAQTESNLNPSAVSPAGAVGVMQLMPETASGLGVTNIYNPEENIDGGVRYLKQMLTEFGGDVTKAVAAYNAGPGAVKKYQGIPPYAETRDYVTKVLTSVNG